LSVGVVIRETEQMENSGVGKLYLEANTRTFDQPSVHGARHNALAQRPPFSARCLLNNNNAYNELET
jgi:hypothetical protein